ncbi:MAG: PRC-barrel domain-containing protein [Xanthobacteraceae bacterium]|nr:PRC-barrel domain-containing protein [Xanthobacteraceae bacterium]
MRMLACATALMMLTGVAAAQNRDAANNANAGPGASPAQQFTVTNYYKQDVYDKADNKIGTIDDVLIDKDGRITALIIGVGGFLGVGQKDVSEPFNKVQMTKKNDKWYLVMDASKDSLQNAQGLRYDRNATTWEPDTGNTGDSSSRPANR